jgi:hypothetical protein
MMAYLHRSGVMVERQINAADYGKLIGKSKSTARYRLEQMVAGGKAKKIFTYAEWSVSRCQGGRPSSGTVPAVEYLIYSEPKEGA